MSFILDALKKAESERNRRIAPVLMDARIAPPRRGLPGWALALGAVLLVNLGVVSWLLLRTPSPASPAVAPAVAPVQTAPPAGTFTSPTAPAAAVTGITQGTETATASVTAVQQSPLEAASPAADADNLPSLQELLSAGVALPELQLNLHVYDPAPSLRSVLLNGQRMREGEYSANGVKLERVTPTGVVLEAGGRRFRLDAGG